MPSIESVENFVNLIEKGQTLLSMERFYAEEASVRENMASPRTGKSALIKHEQEALASIKSLNARCIRPVFIKDDVVVLRWVFTIESKDGKTIRLEELAYQQWAGDLIVQEQFFYDPAQLKLPAPGTT